MDKRDIVYYAIAEGVPCYYQPETGETIPRNKLCELLMNIQDWFWNRFGTPKQFTALFVILIECIKRLFRRK